MEKITTRKTVYGWMTATLGGERVRQEEVFKHSIFRPNKGRFFIPDNNRSLAKNISGGQPFFFFRDSFKKKIWYNRVAQGAWMMIMIMNESWPPRSFILSGCWLINSLIDLTGWSIDWCLTDRLVGWYWNDWLVTVMIKYAWGPPLCLLCSVLSCWLIGW